MSDCVDAATKLINEIERSLDRYSERGSFKIAGVGNLSTSDLESIKLYAEYIVQYGSYGGYLMQPSGSIAEVLDEYGLLDKKAW